MLELSGKYFAASTPAQKSLLAAAGEAMVARGSHGSPGAFAGFLLSSLGTLVMSWAMLKGCVFSRLTAYLGLAGGSLLLIYVCLVTFVPSVRSAAMLVAAPGGLLALAWMILFMLRLFSIAGKEMQH
ncbi:MAG TPA: hypothetical protein VHS59_12145 [Bacillota bacterium]|nr:hypothetical protein [Bacillota bacterium]